MNPQPNFSILIAVYKSVANLEGILKALMQQRCQDFEVVICEDDESPAIAQCVALWKARFGPRLVHVFQEDKGFRKTRILNAGIRASTADFLIFIDGDCLPHPKFISEYKKAARKGIALHGRRVMLSDKISKQLLAGEVKFPPSLLQLVRSGSDKIEDALYLPFIQRKSRASAIWGCNWGIAKQHLLDVNGFDEDYESAGVGEDVDIEWRLLKQGITLVNLKHRAIVYHLHHRSGYTDEQVQVNMRIMHGKISAGKVFCERGVSAAP